MTLEEWADAVLSEAAGYGHAVFEEYEGRGSQGWLNMYANDLLLAAWAAREVEL